MSTTKISVSIRQTWKELREIYLGQWVELVDFDWDWNTPHPTVAKVRNSSSDRTELVELIARTGSLDDSVILFIGGVASSVVELDSSASVF